MWQKVRYGKISKSCLLAKRRLMKISVPIHQCVHLTLPFWLQRIPEIFYSFPGKFTLCAKMVKINYGKILKIFFGYVKISGISALFPPCAHEIIPFELKRIPENFVNFPRKFTLCTKLSPKMSLLEFLKSYARAMSQSMEILLPFHSRAP